MLQILCQILASKMSVAQAPPTNLPKVGTRHSVRRNSVDTLEAEWSRRTPDPSRGTFVEVAIEVPVLVGRQRGSLGIQLPRVLPVDKRHEQDHTRCAPKEVLRG